MSPELQSSQNLELDSELWINWKRWSDPPKKKFHMVCPHVSNFLLFLHTDGIKHLLYEVILQAFVAKFNRNLKLFT